MGGGGSLQISSDRDDQRIFWGLKFPYREFFRYENFCKYQHAEAHNMQVFFSSFSRFLEIFQIIYGSGYIWDIFRFKFWSRDFWGLV